MCGYPYLHPSIYSGTKKVATVTLKVKRSDCLKFIACAFLNDDLLTTLMQMQTSSCFS